MKVSDVVHQHARDKEAAASKRPPDRVEEMTANSLHLEFKTRDRIQTLAELIKVCEVDTDIWEVERFVCNKWEMGYKDAADKGQALPLFQVKAWFKKKVIVELVKKDIARLKAEALTWSPKPVVIIKVRSSNSGIWVEHCLFDHHFGSLIWDKETGHDPYDLSIARKCWADAIGTLAGRTDSFKPEGALFPIGNDQINADNRAGMTEKGTPQSNDSRYQKVYSVSRDATVWGIEQMLARYGRVHVVPVMGNHDPLSTWHLGEYLVARFANQKRVTIDNRATFRKWWEHGVNMIMYAHGNTGKLEDYGKTMASEQPEMWGRTRWREAHTGDKHQRRLIEQPGCTVRILPTLRPPCAWSAENMYDSIRAAESYVWSKTEALVGTATYSILPGKKMAG